MVQQQNPHITAKELQEDLIKAGTKVSVQNIKRTLCKQEHHAQKLHCCTQFLTKKHMKRWLEYEKINKDRPEELELELFGPMDQQYVYYRKGQAYDKNNAIQTVKHRGGSVIFAVALQLLKPVNFT